MTRAGRDRPDPPPYRPGYRRPEPEDPGFRPGEEVEPDRETPGQEPGGAEPGTEEPRDGAG